MRVGQRRQQPVAEVRVVEALGADQQHVDRAGAQRLLDGLPLLGVRRVDGVGRDAGARRRLDLVAHQGQQRRHDQRRPGALGPQQPGGHEVDRRLAPPGALHDERPAAVGDERLDRRPLVVAQRHVVAPDERPQDLLGVGSHAGTVPRGCHGSGGRTQRHARSGQHATPGAARRGRPRSAGPGSRRATRSVDRRRPADRWRRGALT